MAIGNGFGGGGGAVFAFDINSSDSLSLRDVVLFSQNVSTAAFGETLCRKAFR